MIHSATAGSLRDRSIPCWPVPLNSGGWSSQSSIYGPVHLCARDSGAVRRWTSAAPATCRRICPCGSGSASASRTQGRSSVGTGSSSPAMARSRAAVRMARLVPKLVVDALLAHAGPGGDGRDAGAAVAGRGEQLGGRRGDPRPGGPGSRGPAVLGWLLHGWLLAVAVWCFAHTIDYSSTTKTFL